MKLHRRHGSSIVSSPSPSLSSIAATSIRTSAVAHHRIPNSKHCLIPFFKVTATTLTTGLVVANHRRSSSKCGNSIVVYWTCWPISPETIHRGYRSSVCSLELVYDMIYTYLGTVPYLQNTPAGRKRSHDFSDSGTKSPF